jgi:HK97 gp10 family phage protein
MARASFELKGLDAYLEEIVRAGEDVDKVAAQVLNEARPIAEGELHTNLRKTSETWTGAADKTIFATPVQQDGNYIFFELGADVAQDPAGIYKEFGTTRQTAEPFVRPAFTKLRRSGIKAMLKQLMERMEIPTK